jgi:hypothetical protein
MIDKIQLKLFTKDDVPVEGYVPVFHRWIRERVLDELMIDVVDYSHVADGPHVVLIGHEVDYALDRGRGKLGLLFVHKRGPRPERLSHALARAVKAALLLEAEKGAEHPLKFRSDALLIRIADRLNAPNTDATYERLLPGLKRDLEALFGAGKFELKRVGSAREPFTVEVKAEGAAPLADLAKRLSIS